MSETRRLEDRLSRYEAYQELRNIWQDGVVAIERMQPQYHSKADVLLLAALKSAIELVDRQLEVLSGFDMKKFQLMRTINDLPTADKIPVTDREVSAQQGRQKEVPPVLDDRVGTDGTDPLNG